MIRENIILVFILILTLVASRFYTNSLNKRKRKSGAISGGYIFISWTLFTFFILFESFFLAEYCGFIGDKTILAASPILLGGIYYFLHKKDFE